MPRHLLRPLVPVLALLALLVLSPALATAQPPGKPILSAERPEPAPGLFSQLWGLLSALWSENGSLLDPNGASATGSGTEPDATTTGDNGSLLDPDGRP
jgi:hypothetical protein